MQKNIVSLFYFTRRVSYGIFTSLNKNQTLLQHRDDKWTQTTKKVTSYLFSSELSKQLKDCTLDRFL